MADTARPTYETEHSLSREEKVAKVVAKAWSCEAVKMPKFYKCDSALTRGKTVKAFLEIKCRDVLPDTYKTIILSADKFTYLAEMERSIKVPCYFVVRFSDDSIRYARISDVKDFTVEIGGRTDRNDSDDREAVVHIPISQFGVVKPLGAEISTT